MINKLVEDINKALDNEAYFSALSLALTLPDICGKAEFPKAKSGRRYISWYDKYIGQYEKCPCEHCKTRPMPYLSGEVVYSLRNSLLHQGTPNVDNDKIDEFSNKVDEFTLIIEKKNKFDIYSDSACVSTSYLGAECLGESRAYSVNVRRLCLILTLSAKGYFNDNKKKFNFFKFNIIDCEEEQAKRDNIVKLKRNKMITGKEEHHV